MKNSFITLFNRDIKRLYNEIDAYTDEADLWKLEGSRQSLFAFNR
jgi:hypothetical protein